MIVTTYTCDKCGHHQTTNDQMWGVGVVLQHGMVVSDYGPRLAPQVKGLWCRPCIESIGLLCAPPKPDDKDAPAPPTLEDMIREIVANAVQELGEV